MPLAAAPYRASGLVQWSQSGHYQSLSPVAISLKYHFFNHLTVNGKLLARAPVGIRFNEHASDLNGPTLFAHACKLGLEGIVSKRRDLPYRSGRSKAWLKVKNPASPAIHRAWSW